MWIDTETGQPADESAVFAAYPNTVFARNSAGDIEPPERFVPLVIESKPDYDRATHKAVPQAPKAQDGTWRIGWSLKALTAAEKARRAQVPATVSRAQGKIALIQAGVWPAVLAAVDAISDPVQRAVAEVSLHDTQEWRVDSPFLHAMADKLGLTDEQFDSLFVAAGGVAI